MDSPRCRPSGSARVALPTDRLVLYRDATSSPSSVKASESNELPARQPPYSKARRMSRRGSYMREQVPCPKCGSRVQGQYMRKHDKNMHPGGRRRIHVCPYCSADKASLTGRITCRTHISTAWMRIWTGARPVSHHTPPGVRRFQLQRTSRGWVRIKKKHPLI